MQTATAYRNSNTNGSLQKNINTVLLSLCTAGIIWTLKTVNDLEVRIGKLETSTGIYNDAHAKTQQDVNRNGNNISDLQIRVSNLELLSQQKK